MSCNKYNNLTFENYHKVKGSKQIAPIEDYHIRGSNYMNYDNKPTPYEIDMKILSHRTSGLPHTLVDKSNKKIIPKAYN